MGDRFFLSGEAFDLVYFSCGLLGGVLALGGGEYLPGERPLEKLRLAGLRPLDHDLLGDDLLSGLGE